MELSQLVLPEKPAALEFTNKESSKLIVTTYQLQDAKNLHYTGSVYELAGSKILKHVTLPGGVFRFTRQPDGQIITALTNGSIGIIVADNDLNPVHTVQVITGTLLSVSACGNKVLCSDAAGHLHIVALDAGTVSSSFVGHISPYTKEPCEVWTAIWLDGNCALSGAEDNLLKLWDFRANDKQPVSVNRVHQCGIVSLNSEEDSEHLIISGSYDEYLRRIDLRNFNEPLLERKMPGGVWSVRIADQKSYIVSCMYGGWALVGKETLEILQANNKLGENLLYDADFSPQASIVVSCTFNNYTLNFEAV